MNAEEQRELVFRVLAEREEIARRTRSAVEERKAAAVVDPLAAVAPEDFAKFEEEYQAARGRFRHVGHDGRVHWLTEQQIANRKQGRSRNQRTSVYYGARAPEKRTMLQWAFNLGAVAAGLVIVYLFLA